MMSDGVNRDPADKVVATQTQVPWCAGGRAFRFFMAKDFSLKSDAFCCETSISALATMSPEEEKEKEQHEGENSHKFICSVKQFRRYFYGYVAFQPVNTGFLYFG